MNVTLTVTAGPHMGREFVFDRHDTFLVGRSKDAHLQFSFDDPYFSRRHFLVEVNPPRVKVYDLNSSNGIVVNGVKQKVADLKDGDELQAGNTIFSVRVASPAGPPPEDPDEQRTLSRPPAEQKTLSHPPKEQKTLSQEEQKTLKRQTIKPGQQSASETIDYVSNLQIPGYTVESELGRGGMGVVYRGTRISDGQAVALKVITPDPGSSRKDAERFLREARIMTALQHRHIVPCLDCGEVGGILFLAMELVTGPDLRVWVKERGLLDVRTAVGLTLHALKGLAHAHEKGYVHRDVKPANLLLDGAKSARVARLADFGLARAFDTCNLSGLTMQGEVGGTPAFMAPEQVTHYRDVKPAADQYAAAATLYYLLTGQYSLDLESTVAAQLVQIVTEDRIPIRSRRPDLPADLEKVIQKALSREPSGRFANVAALHEALNSFA